MNCHRRRFKLYFGHSIHTRPWTSSMGRFPVLVCSNKRQRDYRRLFFLKVVSRLWGCSVASSSPASEWHFAHSRPRDRRVVRNRTKCGKLGNVWLGFIVVIRISRDSNSPISVVPSQLNNRTEWVPRFLCPLIFFFSSGGCYTFPSYTIDCNLNVFHCIWINVKLKKISCRYCLETKKAWNKRKYPIVPTFFQKKTYRDGIIWPWSGRGGGPSGSVYWNF